MIPLSKTMISRARLQWGRDQIYPDKWMRGWFSMGGAANWVRTAGWNWVLGDDSEKPNKIKINNHENYEWLSNNKPNEKYDLCAKANNKDS